MPRLGKVETNDLEDCDQESRYNVLSMRASTPGRSTYPSRRMGGGSTDNVTLDRRHIQEGNRGTLRREEMAIIFTDGAAELLALLASSQLGRLPMPWQQRNGSFVFVCFAVCKFVCCRCLPGLSESSESSCFQKVAPKNGAQQDQRSSVHLASAPYLIIVADESISWPVNEKELPYHLHRIRSEILATLLSS